MSGGGAGQPHAQVPRLADGALRVVALGGIGEIGRNMTVFEYEDSLLVVDCGVLFPEDDSPGVDLILPDFSNVEERLDRIEALVLTHGHEDHIGAIPFLLKLREDIPIVGSPFTLALVSAKCSEHRQRPNLIEVTEGRTTTHGPFRVEYLAVNHSIPDALALAIHTPAGLVLHTGDLKLDQIPLDDRPTDLPGLARVGERGVDLMMVDSTNADVPGYVGSEREVSIVLDSVISRASQRVIIACFASNVHRVQQVINVAARCGRKVVFVGRSMVRNMELARQLGILSAPSDLVVDLDEGLRLPEHEVVFVSTGSQGEPLSALSRMARSEHRQISIIAGDLVILASSLIPGNEMAIYRVMNGLAELGATVVHQGTANVHASGHAHAGELLLLYGLVRPSAVMPVHGEWRHLKANAELAAIAGVPADNVLIAPNGVVVDLIDGKISMAGKIEVGQVYVDGLSVGDVGESTLSDRLVLGVGGFIAVTVAIDSSTGKPAARPTVSGRGFSDDPNVLREVLPLVEMELTRLEAEGIGDPHRIAQAVRRVVGRWVATAYRRRPMIVPTVISL